MKSDTSKDINSCSTMSPMEKLIRRLAGFFVTLSVVMGYFVSPYWFLFTLFVGLNLFQSSFTNWCLAEDILTKIGFGKKRNIVDNH